MTAPKPDAGTWSAIRHNHPHGHHVEYRASCGHLTTHYITHTGHLGR